MSNSKNYEGNLITKISQALNEIKENGYVPNGNLKIKLTDIEPLYIVVDVDNLYQEIKVEKDKSNIAHWIISNPCFEIWLYYSYHDSPKQDFSLENLDIDKRSRVLKSELDKIHKGGIGCREAFTRINEAGLNSKKNYFENEDGMPSLYSTKMHILAEDIYAVIHTQFNERLRLRKEQIKKFYTASKK